MTILDYIKSISSATSGSVLEAIQTIASGTVYIPYQDMLIVLQDKPISGNINQETLTADLPELDIKANILTEDYSGNIQIMEAELGCTI